MDVQSSGKFGKTLATELGWIFQINPSDIDDADIDLVRSFAFETASDADEFAHWYLRSEAFSKYSGSRRPDARERAITKFWEGNETCRSTNTRLANGNLDPFVTKVLARAGEYILKAVTPVFTMENVLKFSNFGPGATAMVGRAYSSRPEKWEPSVFKGKPHYATLGTLPFLHAFEKRNKDLDLPHEFVIVPGDQEGTATKNYKSDRIMNMQPAWTLFFQKGVGGCLRLACRSVGLLWPNAQETQRRRAREGSIDGKVATIDLANASGTIAFALVRSVFDEPVWSVMTALRASAMWRCQSIDGKLTPPSGWEAIPYDLYSTMGNGFTFEMETLLFWAIVAATCSFKGHHWSTTTVFGDDIICPSDCRNEVVHVLQVCGLSVNPHKSFWEGPFRESCGGHYWKGSDVTPFYLKELPSEMDDWINLHNRITSWCKQRGWGSYGEFSNIIRRLKRQVPRVLRGPEGLEGCLWSGWDESAPKWNKDLQCYEQFVVTRVTKSASSHSEGVEQGAYLNALYSMGESRTPASIDVSREINGRRVSVTTPNQRFKLLRKYALMDGKVNEINWEKIPRPLTRLKVDKVMTDANCWSCPTMLLDP